jgi:hypothetical protein
MRTTHPTEPRGHSPSLTVIESNGGKAGGAPRTRGVPGKVHSLSGKSAIRPAQRHPPLEYSNKVVKLLPRGARAAGRSQDLQGLQIERAHRHAVMHDAANDRAYRQRVTAMVTVLVICTLIVIAGVWLMDELVDMPTHVGCDSCNDQFVSTSSWIRLLLSNSSVKA